MTLKGKVALVTGAGRGLGRIMAQGLSQAGASVALVARSRSQLDEVAESITATGGKAFVCTADVTDRLQVEAAVAASVQALGPLDILINNAGAEGSFGPVGLIDPDAWWQTQALHVLGPLYFMTAVIPAMSERGQGRIINICSLAGTAVIPNMSAYAVAKNTESRLTQHVAAEWGEKGIRAFALEPGTIHTAMSDQTINSPEAQKWVPQGIEFLKSVTPEQSDAATVRLVEMIIALASGRYDGLSGRYLEPQDDFDALLNESLSSR